MKYKKRLEVVEAVRWNGDFASFDWPDWFSEAVRGIRGVVWINEDRSISVRTKEGIIRADVGDMIVQGVLGDLRPVRSGIFELTYEQTDDA